MIYPSNARLPRPRGSLNLATRLVWSSKQEFFSGTPNCYPYSQASFYYFQFSEVSPLSVDPDFLPQRHGVAEFIILSVSAGPGVAGRAGVTLWLTPTDKPSTPDGGTTQFSIANQSERNIQFLYDEFANLIQSLGSLREEWRHQGKTVNHFIPDAQCDIYLCGFCFFSETDRIIQHGFIRSNADK
jgi:hypothetical protein